jgi:hypothetical protein
LADGFLGSATSAGPENERFGIGLGNKLDERKVRRYGGTKGRDVVEKSDVACGQ